ncbi:MAG: hybrid histidine protein kinase RetS [Pseudomonadota bacterium]
MPPSILQNPLIIRGSRKFLLILLLLWGFFAGFAASSSVALSQQWHADRGARLAMRLAAQVSVGMGYWGTDRLLAWLARQPERHHVSRLEIIDLDGRVVAAFVAESQPETKPLFGQIPAITEPILGSALNQQDAGTQYARVAGYIRITLSSADLNRQILWNLRQVGGISLVFLLILVGVGWYLMTVHFHPLHQLHVRLRELSGESHPIGTEVTGSADLRVIQAGLDRLISGWALQLNRSAHEKQNLLLRIKHQERTLDETNARLTQTLALVDIERRARLFFLAEVESEVRPRLMKLTESANPGVAGTGAFELIPVFDSLLSDWRQDIPDHQCRFHQFDPHQYLEHLVGILTASLPHIGLILLISPELPRVVAGDPVNLTRVLGRWLIQLGRVMHRGNLIIRVKPSRVQGQSGWLVLVHAPIPQLAPDIRERMAFVFSSGLVGHTTHKAPGVDSVLESMKGIQGASIEETQGVFYYLKLPMESPEKVSGVPQIDDIQVCVIDSIPLSRRAWIWQLHNLGITARACGTVEEARCCIGGGTASLKILVLSQQDLWRHASKAEDFIDTCLLLKTCPVLILPYGDFEGRDYYRRAGAICLTKPVRSDDWRSLIETLRQRMASPVTPDPVVAASIATGTHQADQSGAAPGGVLTAVTARLRDDDPSADEPGSVVSGYVAALLAATRNNKTLAVRLLTKLLSELPVQLQGIRDALQTGETRKARDIVHQLNGAAGLCGLGSLQQAANQLETVLIRALENDESPDYLAVFNELAREVECLRAVGSTVLQSLTLVSLDDTVATAG